MAKSVGINTSDVLLMEDVVINNKVKDILLVKRFDRELINGINYRKPLVSGLTVIQGSEFTSRYLGYMDLVEKSNIQANERKELYKRLLFNILVGNTDDHAKNHCFFWNSGNHELKMTPVYDISPLPRKTNDKSSIIFCYYLIKYYLCIVNSRVINLKILSLPKFIEL